MRELTQPPSRTSKLHPRRAPSTPAGGSGSSGANQLACGARLPAAFLESGPKHQIVSASRLGVPIRDVFASIAEIFRLLVTPASRVAGDDAGDEWGVQASTEHAPIFFAILFL